MRGEGVVVGVFIFCIFAQESVLVARLYGRNTESMHRVTIILAVCATHVWGQEVGKAVEAKPTVRRLEGDRMQVGAVIFNHKTREVELPAKVNMNAGPLEYVLVHHDGKTHESLLKTAVTPVELNTVFTLLDWQKSQTFFDFSKPERGGVFVKGAQHLPATHMLLSVAWKDAKDGAVHKCPLEEWLLNLEKKAPITRGPFIYTGSFFAANGVFQAQESGSHIALYQDPGALINNPREGTDLDDVWTATKAVPELETDVTLIIRPNDSIPPTQHPKK